MKTEDIIKSLESLEKYEAIADCFQDVNHEKDRDGSWISIYDLNVIIDKLKSTKNHQTEYSEIVNDWQKRVFTNPNLGVPFLEK